MDWKKEMKLEDLDSPYFEIAEKFGIEVAIGVEQLFHGRQIYFPFLEYVCRDRVHEKIIEECNGYNFVELARKYGYSERHIRRICEEKLEKEKLKPLDGQLNMFE